MIILLKFDVFDMHMIRNSLYFLLFYLFIAHTIHFVIVDILFIPKMEDGRICLSVKILG